MSDAPELERERLIVEARRLVADAGDNPLDEAATARFGQIEQRLDQLRAEQDNRPAVVDPTTRPTAPGVSPSQAQRDARMFGVPASQGQVPDARELGVLPSLMPAREQAAELFAAFRARTPVHAMTVTAPDPGLGFATPITTTTGGHSDAYRPHGPITPRRLAAVAGIPVDTVAWGEGVAFPKWGAGSAGTQTEGSAKSEYNAITAGSASMSTIAVWTDITNQLGSMVGFEAALRLRLAQLVSLKEDAVLQTAAAAAATTYTPVASEPRADSLLGMAAKIMGAGYTADVALVNPGDLAGANGILHNATGALGEQPDSQMRLNLYGLTIYPTVSQAAGSATVGAWREGSTLAMGIGPTYGVDPYSQLKSNITTVLLEEAVALLIPDGAAFNKCTFAV